jgi:hypothetical protein
VKVVTARIYVNEDEGEDPKEVLAELLTTYASGLIDPEEREELLLKIDLLSVLDVEECWSPDDVRELEEVHASQPYLAE